YLYPLAFAAGKSVGANLVEYCRKNSAVADDGRRQRHEKNIAGRRNRRFGIAGARIASPRDIRTAVAVDAFARKRNKKFGERDPGRNSDDAKRPLRHSGQSGPSRKGRRRS